MGERDELKLFQEIKDKYEPENRDSLDELIKKKDKYDINPNTNYAIFDLAIKSNEPKLEELFYDYNPAINIFAVIFKK